MDLLNDTSRKARFYRWLIRLDFLPWVAAAIGIAAVYLELQRRGYW
jgi:hypothetical protein